MPGARFVEARFRSLCARQTCFTGRLDILRTCIFHLFCVHVGAPPPPPLIVLKSEAARTPFADRPGHVAGRHSLRCTVQQYMTAVVRVGVRGRGISG